MIRRGKWRLRWRGERDGTLGCSVVVVLGVRGKCRGVIMMRLPLFLAGEREKLRMGRFFVWVNHEVRVEGRGFWIIKTSQAEMCNRGSIQGP